VRVVGVATDPAASGAGAGGSAQPEPPPVFQAHLEHGVDPAVLAHQHGQVVVRPLEALRDSDGELVLRLLVRPQDGEPAPRQDQRGRDAGLVVPPGTQLEVRQRFAAYAVVTSERGLLATEYSARTAALGRWGMPGGGIDPGEQPVAAVLREVMEETAQAVEIGELLAVQTSHWVGRSPRDTLEDFQAVRLVYRGRCPEPREPEVLDQGGTTASARWVPVPSWRSLPWTHNWEQLLDELFPHGEDGD